MRTTLLYSDWQKILDKLDLTQQKISHLMPQPVEYIAQCPKCKTMETIEIVDKELIPSSKFYQRGGNIYHDCGSNQPCILHR